MIDAFFLIKDKYLVDAELWVFGDGPEKDFLQSKVEMLELEESVIFHGYKGNLCEFLVQGHVFIYASLYEGFGNVLVEAQVCGLPIVAYELNGPIHEIVNNQALGCVIAAGDADAFAKSAYAYYVDAKPVDVISSAANRFNVEKIGNQYCEVIL